MNTNSRPLIDWLPRGDQHAILTALGQLDEAIQDTLCLARAVAEERRQQRLEADYLHAAERQRVDEALRAFRESYRRRAS